MKQLFTEVFDLVLLSKGAIQLNISDFSPSDRVLANECLVKLIRKYKISL
jgi:hypothetical protein